MKRRSVNDVSSDEAGSNSHAAYPPEPFVRPEVVADFLGIDPGTVVRFVKAGLIPGHPLRVAERRIHWRFLLSEVREAMLAREPKHVRNAHSKERL